MENKPQLKQEQTEIDKAAAAIDQIIEPLSLPRKVHVGAVGALNFLVNQATKAGEFEKKLEVLSKVNDANEETIKSLTEQLNTAKEELVKLNSKKK